MCRSFLKSPVTSCLLDTSAWKSHLSFIPRAHREPPSHFYLFFFVCLFACLLVCFVLNQEWMLGFVECFLKKITIEKSLCGELHSLMVNIRASLMIQLVKNRLKCRKPGFDPWIGQIPWRREQQPTPAFWPGEFHGLYSPWSLKESDTTE